MSHQVNRPYGIKVLVEGIEPVIDLVAIHGLDGGQETSWTADNNALWLRDFLPSFIPHARIISYGYDGKTRDVSQFSCQRLYDHAIGLVTELTLFRESTKTRTRPIIFIAHSVGGIILKDGLIHSNSANKNNLEHHNAIKTSTYGILFFGTPHRGADIIKLTRKMFDAARLKKTNLELGDGVSEGSELLQKQTTQYNHISSDFVTKCFYGTYKSSSENKTARTSASTIPGATNVEVISINSDQEDMVRYRSAEDDGFRKVLACITLMLVDAPVTISKRWEQWNRLREAEGEGVQGTFVIPFEPEYLRNKHFTGRQSILDNLQSAIVKAHSSNDMALAILIGLGGTGKTQIASEYTYLHQEEYQSIFWVNAATKESAEAGFTAIAQRLVREHARISNRAPNYLSIARYLDMVGVFDQNGDLSTDIQNAGKIIKGVKSWFSKKKNNRWLLILDNVDDLDNSDIKIYIPTTTHGTVIMTSRRTDSASLGTGLDVDIMGEEEGKCLYLKSASLDDDFLATEIVRRLGGLPLAIVQAGAYISVRKITPKRYLEIYEKYFHEVMGNKPSSATWSYGDRTVRTTWEISYQAIKETNPETANLLSLCSFLSNEGIRDDMLRRGMDLREDDITLDDMLYLLFSYSLAKRKGKDREASFDIHPLVHLWAHKRLPLSECKRLASNAISLIINAAQKDSDRAVRRQFERLILQHISTTGKNATEYVAFTLLDKEGASKTSEIAKILLEHGRWDEAETLQLQLVKRAEHFHLYVSEYGYNALAKGSPAQAEFNNILRDSVTALALSYYAQHKGHHIDALLTRYTRLISESILHNSKRNLGHYTAAGISFEEIQKSEQSHEINNNFSTSPVIGVRDDVNGIEYNQLVLSCENGQFREGQKRFEQVVEDNKRHLGLDHQHTIGSMGNLVRIYVHHARHELREGRWGEIMMLKAAAEAVAVETLEIAKSSYSERHSLTLDAHLTLSLLYFELGQLTTMLSLLLPVINAMEEVWGVNDFRFQSANYHLLEAQDRIKTLGEIDNWTDDESIQAAVVNDALESILLTQGGQPGKWYIPEENEVCQPIQRREGEEDDMLLLRKLRQSIAVFGSCNPRTVMLREKLGIAYLKKGDIEKAKKQREKGFEGMKQDDEIHYYVLLDVFHFMEYKPWKPPKTPAQESILCLEDTQDRTGYILEEEVDDGIKMLSKTDNATENGSIQPTGPPLARGSMVHIAGEKDEKRYTQDEAELCIAAPGGQGEENEMVLLHKIQQSIATFGRGDIKTLVLRFKLGKIYIDKGNHKEFENQFQTAVKDGRDFIDESSVHDTTTQNLAKIIFDTERLLEIHESEHHRMQDEEPMLQEAINRSLAPNEDTDDGGETIRHLAGLSDCQFFREVKWQESGAWRRREWETAEKYGRKTVEYSDRILGHSHWETLGAMARLGHTYTMRNNWKGAQMLQQSILDSRRSSLGSEHPLTLSAMAALATSFWYQSDFPNAAILERKLLKARIGTLGSDHQDTLSTMRNLAATYASQNKYGQAIKLQKRVVDVLSRTVRYSFKGGKMCRSEIGTDNELYRVYQEALEGIQQKESINTEEATWRLGEVCSWMTDKSPRFTVASLAFLMSFIFSSIFIFLCFFNLLLITFPLRIYQHDIFPRVLKAFMDQFSGSTPKNKIARPRERVRG